MAAILAKAIPQHQWNPSAFVQPVVELNKVEVIERAGKFLKVKELEDWYSVKSEDLARIIGSFPLEIFK
jgi:hypothetical protein